jgi:type II secretory pathway component PulM
MIAAAMQWWRTRTSREQTLLKVAALLLIAGLGPMAALQSVSRFRQDAASDLARAEATAGMVAAMKTQNAGPALPPYDGSLRGLVIAAAGAVQLPAPVVEPLGVEHVRVAFAPSPSASVYAWLTTMAMQGAAINKSAMVRAGETGLVTAEFEVARTP